MPTLTSKTRIKPRLTTQPQQNQPAAAQHDTVEVRRCCICGSMATIGGDLEITHSLTLEGTTHGLATCSTNAVCSYQAGLLAERLEFRDTDRAPKPKELEGIHLALTKDESAVLNEAIELARRVCQEPAPDSIPSDGECLQWIALTYITTMKDTSH